MDVFDQWFVHHKSISIQPIIYKIAIRLKKFLNPFICRFWTPIFGICVQRKDLFFNFFVRQYRVLSQTLRLLLESQIDQHLALPFSLTFMLYISSICEVIFCILKRLMANITHKYSPIVCVLDDETMRYCNFAGETNLKPWQTFYCKFHR